MHNTSKGKKTLLFIFMRRRFAGQKEFVTYDRHPSPDHLRVIAGSLFSTPPTQRNPAYRHRPSEPAERTFAVPSGRANLCRPDRLESPVAPEAPSRCARRRKGRVRPASARIGPGVTREGGERKGGKKAVRKRTRGEKAGSDKSVVSRYLGS